MGLMMLCHLLPDNRTCVDTSCIVLLIPVKRFTLTLMSISYIYIGNCWYQHWGTAVILSTANGNRHGINWKTWEGFSNLWKVYHKWNTRRKCGINTACRVLYIWYAVSPRLQQCVLLFRGPFSKCHTPKRTKLHQVLTCLANMFRCDSVSNTMYTINK